MPTWIGVTLAIIAAIVLGSAEPHLQMYSPIQWVGFGGRQRARRRLSDQLRARSHDLTTIIRVRSTRWVAMHGDAAPELRGAAWVRANEGDDTYRTETVALISEAYRAELLTLVDGPIRAQGVLNDDEWQRFVHPQSLDDWWSIRSLITAISLRLHPAAV